MVQGGVVYPLGHPYAEHNLRAYGDYLMVVATQLSIKDFGYF